MLMHRYEMAIERQLRATIKDLGALTKAGPGPGPAGGVGTEVVASKEVKKKASGPAAEPGPTSPDAPNEPEPGAAPGPRHGSDRGRDDRIRAAEPPDRAGSTV